MLYLFILLNSEKNEPRSAAAVIGGLLVFLPSSITFTEGIFNPSVLRTPPLYFALQNTEEEGESNLPLIADSINSFYCFCFNPLALRVLPLYSLTETPRNAAGHGKGRGLSSSLFLHAVL